MSEIQLVGAHVPVPAPVHPAPPSAPPASASAAPRATCHGRGARQSLLRRAAGSGRAPWLVGAAGRIGQLIARGVCRCACSTRGARPRAEGRSCRLQQSADSLHQDDNIQQREDDSRDSTGNRKVRRSVRHGGFRSEPLSVRAWHAHSKPLSVHRMLTRSRDALQSSLHCRSHWSVD